ncbi:g7499 [Coccomyxa viridis]|uniref:G7499 protein n=1 Tax=Coccomyxa viridis TaxID=1274662 RepID=A0ABP1FY01_9CHLO
MATARVSCLWSWMEPAEETNMHKTASTQSFDSETAAQPALPNLMRFPSACSTPVSSSDLIAMENLRKKASAGKGGDRPGRYGFYGDTASTAALAASQAAMEEGHTASASPVSRATFNVEQPHDDAEEAQDIPLIHVNWPGSSEQSKASSGHPDGLHTPRRSSERPRSGYPTPETPTAAYGPPKKQKGTGILSAPKRPRCCARCPKPFTIFVSSLVVALVLIVGFMIGHYAAPYIQTMTFMQPAGGTAPSMAPHEGVTSSDGRGIEGAGIGLDTGDLIAKDQSPTSQTNPYLVTGRKGMGSPAPLAVTPGGV